MFQKKELHEDSLKSIKKNKKTGLEQQEVPLGITPVKAAVWHRVVSFPVSAIGQESILVTETDSVTFPLQTLLFENIRASC